jgi:hypothetical protein
MNSVRAWLVISLLLSLAVSSTTDAERVDSCGQILRSGDCLIFVTYWTPPQAGFYVLPDTIPLEAESEWRISGDTRRISRQCDGMTYTYALDPISITPCVPETLGCGVLGDCDDEYHCYQWSALGYTGDMFLVDNLSGYSLGDTVLAIGIRANCYSICLCGGGCLLHSTFTSCGDTLTPVLKTSWGRVKALYRE